MAHSSYQEWQGLVTLDCNPDAKPDVLYDLSYRWLPFRADSFDEIHAYQVLEHFGRIGNARGFFAEFMDYWRVLKPNGLLFAHVPAWNDEWALGDPGHCRVIPPGMLNFLIRPEYERQVGHNTMADYRYMYSADFDVDYAFMGKDKPDPPNHGVFYFVLRAIKPVRGS